MRSYVKQSLIKDFYFLSVVIDCVPLDVFDEGGAGLGLDEFLGAVEVVQAWRRVIAGLEPVVALFRHRVLQAVSEGLDVAAIRSAVRIFSRGALSEPAPLGIASLDEG